MKVAGLTEMEVKDAEGLLRLVESAAADRRTAATEVNDTSSRSHAIYRFTFRVSAARARACASSSERARLSELSP